MLSEYGSTRLRRRLTTLARSGRPVVVGPWLGEVGFELLYWIPFLRWAVRDAGLDRSQLLVISRGGTGAWYRPLASRYVDVFDFLGEDEFHARNRARHDEVGEQKQIRRTEFEDALVARAAAHVDLATYEVLHPSSMFELLNPYWWGHRGVEWVERHARFERLEADAQLVPAGLPARYTAVKFYFNDCFPPTTENQAAARRVVRQLADEGPVISLATGLRLDEHHAWDEEERMGVHGIRPALTASNNLGVQAAIIARASGWAGTYGGFSYLAPFYGVPARAFYSNGAGYSARHLELARRVFARFGPDLLEVNDARTWGGPCQARPSADVTRSAPQATALH